MRQFLRRIFRAFDFWGLRERVDLREKRYPTDIPWKKACAGVYRGSSYNFFKSVTNFHEDDGWILTLFFTT